MLSHAVYALFIVRRPFILKYYICAQNRLRSNPYFLPNSTLHIAADECLQSDQTLQLQTIHKSRVKLRAKTIYIFHAKNPNVFSLFFGITKDSIAK